MWLSKWSARCAKGHQEEGECWLLSETGPWRARSDRPRYSRRSVGSQLKQVFISKQLMSVRVLQVDFNQIKASGPADVPHMLWTPCSNIIASHDRDFCMKEGKAAQRSALQLSSIIDRISNRLYHGGFNLEEFLEQHYHLQRASQSIQRHRCPNLPIVAVNLRWLPPIRTVFTSHFTLGEGERSTPITVHSSLAPRPKLKDAGAPDTMFDKG